VSKAPDINSGAYFIFAYPSYLFGKWEGDRQGPMFNEELVEKSYAQGYPYPVIELLSRAMDGHPEGTAEELERIHQRMS